VWANAHRPAADGSTIRSWSIRSEISSMHADSGVFQVRKALASQLLRTPVATS